MSSTITAARRRRALLLASSFLALVSLGISAAQAQHAAIRAAAADRGQPAHRPEPDPRKADYDERRRHRARPAAAPRNLARPGTGAARTARQHGRGSTPAGRHRRAAIQRHRRHIFDRHHRGGYRAFAVANAARDHRAGAGRAVAVAVWRRQRRQDLGRPARLRRVRHRQHPVPDQRPPAQRHRHGRRRSLDHSAQFDRAHRDHPRQQRRGALRRQRGRRRHQYRH